MKRTTDLAARYGGEEFAVVPPGVDEAGALAMAASIRAEVAYLKLPHGASPAGPFVTVSIGAASIVPVAGLEGEALIAAADTALYHAKEPGRNTVAAGMIELSPDAGAAAHSVSRVRIHHPGS